MHCYSKSHNDVFLEFNLELAASAPLTRCVIYTLHNDDRDVNSTAIMNDSYYFVFSISLTFFAIAFD